jgi:sulfite reductase (NADPH) flavoprotein alpha-component
MTLSFWRYSHLALAVFSSLFLVMASLTGIILAVDAIQEKTPSYRVENFSEITLEQILPGLKKVYPEITELSVDHNQFVTLQGIDQEGDDFNSYIDPRTGKVLGQPIKKSEFIQWTTALHRSLFLKETGRFFVGLISFILALIAISGLVLVVKRQQGFRNFFSKIVKEQAVQYYHVVLGRWSLIPILIIALTGAYLSLERFNFFCEQNSTTEKTAVTIKQTSQNTAASAFKTILLADVQKI